MARIAMPHIGLDGHIRPAVRFGEALVRQGHRVIALAPERYRALIEATGAEFHPHEPLVTREAFPSLPDFAGELALATERCLGELIECLHRAELDLVVHDVHAPWARVAAEFLGLPRLVTDPLFPYATAPLDGWPDRPWGPGSPPASPWARSEACRSSIQRTWGVDLGPLTSVLNSRAAAIVSFTTEEIIGQGGLPPGWCCVGPLMQSAPPRERTEATRPLVYVAFGTFFNASPGAFAAVLTALADEPVDVLVSTGRGPVAPAQLRPAPPNATVRGFVDSREVLSRSAVHITHGGGSSVHESLLAGVPMVCLPQGSDQFAWAERVEQLGAGRVVAQDVDAIRRAVRELIGDHAAHERAAELGARLAAYPGAEAVARLVERSLASSPAAITG